MTVSPCHIFTVHPYTFIRTMALAFSTAVPGAAAITAGGTGGAALGMAVGAAVAVRAAAVIDNEESWLPVGDLFWVGDQLKTAKVPAPYGRRRLACDQMACSLADLDQ